MKRLFSKLPSILFVVVAVSLISAAQCLAQEKLYTKTITISGPRDNEKRDSVFTTVTTPTFEIGFHSISQGTKYSAQKTIERPKVGQEFRQVKLYLANADGTDVFFKDADEFIAYMDARGYQKTTETKQRFSVEYIFSKK
ncbi:MAG TPA: hypothetical protein VGD65_06235 [Chryseosolibacter sp.]